MMRNAIAGTLPPSAARLDLGNDGRHSPSAVNVSRRGNSVPRLSMGWQAVARRAVYFGHQSVGAHIVGGLEALADEFSLALRIVQTRDPSVITGPAFVHFLAGKNGDPISKNESLLRFLGSRRAANRAIVLLKYCYVDVQSESDVLPLFSEYCRTVGTIRSNHPDVTVVHTTIPLTTVEPPFKAAMKEFLGRRSARHAGIARHYYNELIRTAFDGSEPIFDLARIETMQDNGSPASLTVGGFRIDTLASDNTYDGGHLNERGQRAVAAELLNVLSKVVREKC